MNKRDLNCSDCKFFDYDEYYDPDSCEEYGVFECKKNHYDHISFNAEPCADFEEED